MDAYTIYVNKNYGFNAEGNIGYFDSIEAAIDFISALCASIGRTYKNVANIQNIPLGGPSKHSIIFYNERMDDDLSFPITQVLLDETKPNICLWKPGNNLTILNRDEIPITNVHTMRTPLAYGYRCDCHVAPYYDLIAQKNAVFFTSPLAGAKHMIRRIAEYTKKDSTCFSILGLDDVKMRADKRGDFTIKDIDTKQTYMIGFEPHYFTTADECQLIVTEWEKIYKIHPLAKYCGGSTVVLSNVFTGDCYHASFEVDRYAGIDFSSPFFTDIVAIENFYRKILRQENPNKEYEINRTVSSNGLVEQIVFIDERDYTNRINIDVHKNPNELPTMSGCMDAIDASGNTKAIMIPGIVTRLKWTKEGITGDEAIINDHHVFDARLTGEYPFSNPKEEQGMEKGFMFMSINDVLCWYTEYLAYKLETSVMRFEVFKNYDGKSVVILDKYDNVCYKIEVTEVYYIDDMEFIPALNMMAGFFRFRKVSEFIPYGTRDPEEIPEPFHEEPKCIDTGKVFKETWRNRCNIDKYRMKPAYVAVCTHSSDERIFKPSVDTFVFESYEQMDMEIRHAIQMALCYQDMGNIDMETGVIDKSCTYDSARLYKVDERGEEVARFCFEVYLRTHYCMSIIFENK